MLLFHHHISFKTIDPLGAGFSEEIATEQREPEAAALEEGVDEGELFKYWQSVETDIEKDPEWFKFTEEK